MPAVVVLAPMPLEMDAIVRAFGLDRQDERTATGQVAGCAVMATHIGMGPPLTRAALRRLFDRGAPVDHVMIAGICGGLDPERPVGTLINPEMLVDHTSGTTYRHTPPGAAPLEGRLITTEEATLDVERSKRFFADGCIAVDMESAAVADVCNDRGCPWSVYRCIGDRYFDGLLDERLAALTNQDGSGDRAAISRLLETEPELATKLAQLGRDAANAARMAAEAAVRGLQALAGA